MCILTALAFLLAGVLAVCATVAAFDTRLRRTLRYSYLGSVLALAIAAYFTTYHVQYDSNPNTQFWGWPVPSVVFQRSEEDGLVRGFHGPSTFLAYPLNLVLFLLVPSIVLLVLRHRVLRRRVDGS